MIPLFSIVKIKTLLRAPGEYDSWCQNQRHPQIGDKGTIVEILQVPNLPLVYVVECIDKEGRTKWLSDFKPAEIEVVWTYKQEH